MSSRDVCIILLVGTPVWQIESGAGLNLGLNEGARLLPPVAVIKRTRAGGRG